MHPRFSPSHGCFYNFSYLRYNRRQNYLRRMSVVSPTSRFANGRFANVSSQFANVLKSVRKLVEVSSQTCKSRFTHIDKETSKWQSVCIQSTCSQCGESSTFHLIMKYTLARNRCFRYFKSNNLCIQHVM